MSEPEQVAAACPFCGGGHILLQRAFTPAGAVGLVTCTACGAQGPTSIYETALQRWNDRVTPSGYTLTVSYSGGTL